MPTRLIKKEVPPCSHPEHDAPNMQVFELGTYEHTCPACGEKQTFTVHGGYL